MDAISPIMGGRHTDWVRSKGQNESPSWVSSVRWGLMFGSTARSAMLGAVWQLGLLFDKWNAYNNNTCVLRMRHMLLADAADVHCTREKQIVPHVSQLRVAVGGSWLAVHEKRIRLFVRRKGPCYLLWEKVHLVCHREQVHFVCHEKKLILFVVGKSACYLS